MTNKAWIQDQLETYTIKELTSSRDRFYDLFKRDTGSICSFQTYRNLIYKYNKPPLDLVDLLGDNEPRHISGPPELPNSLTKEEKGNELNIISRSQDIKTLDDLIEKAEIDLDVWKVSNHKSNTWTTSFKIDNEIVQANNWQVKATLAKKVLSATEFEPLKPIEIVTSPIKVETSEDADRKTAVIVSDAQVGFIRDLVTDVLRPMHDRDALSIALQTIEEIQPDEIILNGDMLDLSDWSDKFVQSPEFSNLLQKSVIELGWWIAQFHNVAPEAKISFILGNHEERLDRAIIRNLPLAYGLKSINDLDGKSLLSIENMIAFNDFEVNWSKQYPYGEIWLNKRTRVSHGKVIAAGSGATAMKFSKLSNNNEIFGHIHRIETAVKTIYDHEGSHDVGAYSFGCLCKTDGSVPSNIPNLNWQSGFGVVTYTEDTEHITTVHIRNNEANYEGWFISPIEDINEIIFNDIGF